MKEMYKNTTYDSPVSSIGQLRQDSVIFITKTSVDDTGPPCIVSREFVVADLLKIQFQQAFRALSTC